MPGVGHVHVRELSCKGLGSLEVGPKDRRLIDLLQLLSREEHKEVGAIKYSLQRVTEDCYVPRG